jgi:choline-glycine betaine transporter
MLGEKQVVYRIRPLVFFLPMLMLLAGLGFSLFDISSFLSFVTGINDWILKYFAILFNWGSFLFVLTCVWVWFSPLGKVKIGGALATPLLSKWSWFSITLCTTIAIGILFWATAEPMFHFHQPPPLSGIVAGSEEAKRFAISSLYMHWAITPYAIYTVPSLAFALAYHNLGRSYSLSAPLSILSNRFSGKPVRDSLDAVALFALVAGISATLGVGVLSISSGIAGLLGMENNGFLTGAVAAAIVMAFMVSSLTGLMKGIRFLSDLNIKFFFVLVVFLFFVGPTMKVLTSAGTGLVDYAIEFLPRSFGIGATGDPVWSRSWTSFYWANWLAWAPITALFLGRIARGHTVREFIVFNLILPSFFAIVWMSIFGVSAIEADIASGGVLNEALGLKGPESVIYSFFDGLPGSVFWIVAFILLSFLCFVTAADSNTEAIASVCQESDHHYTVDEEDHQPSTLKLKVAWACVIGLTSWTMVTFSGVDGVRMLSNLGGLPALFVVVLMNIALIKMGALGLVALKKG